MLWLGKDFTFFTVLTLVSVVVVVIVVQYTDTRLCCCCCFLLGADCHRFQFECVNKADPSLSECIAVYDRCNAIIQCRDGSDEMDCTTDNTDLDRDQLVSSRTQQQTRLTDAGMENSQRIIQPNSVSSGSSGLGQFPSASQSMVVTGADGTHGSMLAYGRDGMAVGDEMSDAERHLQQMSNSHSALHLQTNNRQESVGTETAAAYQLRKDADVSSVAEPSKSLGRLSGAGHQDRGQMMPGGVEVAESLGKQVAGEKDDVVSERGHLLLSSMVDNADRPQSRYPSTVESDHKQESMVVNPDVIKDNNRKVPLHPKPIFGSVDQSATGSSQSFSVDQSQQQQPVVSSRYQPAAEPRRLRKPDLSRMEHPGPSDLGRVDERPSGSEWQKPAPSSYQYDSSSSRKYFRPSSRPNGVESELPSSSKYLSPSSQAGHESRLGKNYGRASDSSSNSGHKGGGSSRRIPVRTGLTDAQQRNPSVEQKNHDKDLDSGRGFLSKRPPLSSSRYEGSSWFSSPHKFDDAKSSYSHSGGIKPPMASNEGPRHTGLVADDSRYPSNGQYSSNRQYPSNGRDFLYGEPYYPVSDDYYYADGPVGHGYDPQSPVNYDYYNMDTG